MRSAGYCGPRTCSHGSPGRGDAGTRLVSWVQIKAKHKELLEAKDLYWWKMAGPMLAQLPLWISLSLGKWRQDIWRSNAIRALQTWAPPAKSLQQRSRSPVHLSAVCPATRVLNAVFADLAVFGGTPLRPANRPAALRGVTKDALSPSYESMQTQGVLWFPDLTLADTTMILPVAIGALNLLNLEVRKGRSLGSCSSRQGVARWFNGADMTFF